MLFYLVQRITLTKLCIFLISFTIHHCMVLVLLVSLPFHKFVLPPCWCYWLWEIKNCEFRVTPKLNHVNGWTDRHAWSAVYVFILSTFCKEHINIQCLTSKKTQCVSITKINWLTLFRKIITVYSENRMKSINILCVQNSELLNVKVGDTVVYNTQFFKNYSFLKLGYV
jgi:hypothetical protein